MALHEKIIKKVKIYVSKITIEKLSITTFSNNSVLSNNATNV